MPTHDGAELQWRMANDSGQKLHVDAVINQKRNHPGHVRRGGEMDRPLSPQRRFCMQVRAELSQDGCAAGTVLVVSMKGSHVHRAPGRKALRHCSVFPEKPEDFLKGPVWIVAVLHQAAHDVRMTRNGVPRLGRRLITW